MELKAALMAHLKNQKNKPPHTQYSSIYIASNTLLYKGFSSDTTNHNHPPSPHSEILKKAKLVQKPEAA